MIFQFFKKKPEPEPEGDIDPFIQEHKEQTEVRRKEDIETIRQMLERQYPEAENAIEDYRKGYLTEEQLEIRFSREEIDMIHKEKEERDKEDKETPTSGYL